MKLSFSVDPFEDQHNVTDILSGRMRMSRLMIKKIRLYGSLHVNGTPARMIDLVHSGDVIEATFEDDLEQANVRNDCSIPIFYEDDWIIVCNKPAGIVTHPSWQHMDDSLIQRLSTGRLHPIMRLDRETSGLIVIAKNGFAHHVVSSQKMNKEYIGIVHGQFIPQSGKIDLPIARSTDSIMIRVVSIDGQASVTHYQTLSYQNEKGISLVSFTLETGRCHQIRVHCQYYGHPIVGDGLYGPSSNDYPNNDLHSLASDAMIDRQALHAHKLSFFHPITHEELKFECEIPEDMQKLMR